MAEKGKFIVDEALLESKEIEKAFQANAKEILARTMGSEIEEMVKESLSGSKVGLNEDEDDEEMDLDLDMDDMEGDEDAGDAGDDLDLDLGDDEDLELGDMEGEDEDMDLDMEPEMDDDLEVVDLTDADDEEVINVFKKMSPEDEIEVVQDGGNIDIKDKATGAEYRIELGGSEMEGEDEDMDLDMDSEEGEDEVEYQIELDDEDMEGEEEEVEESIAGKRKKYNRYSGSAHHPTTTNESIKPRMIQLSKENNVLKTKVTQVQKENEQLKEDYNKMVDALKQFRTKLNEVAVFNSNLTYAVRLFTENTTTRDEKVDIIKRFDDVRSLKESKNVYKQLVTEISKKAPIKESIEKKLNVTKTSGSAETKINESQVYVNPELEKMKRLWGYDYKK